MPAATEATGPSYISSHSADVILSDIRPIKLKLEALRSINVLLDEFLFNILNTSRSLSTDKLRASLLTILNTSLGKEALLEAEVELRAYWDRTARPPAPEDDTQTFHLQWAFELLRLKCEAYSTLNEADEDSAAVARLQEKMTALGGTTPPMPGLLAPASLYLTAILESICEHILANVGRVAARDSSRTSATVQDVFVALCEDHSIYELFKSMRVYQQIEQLSQAPKPRRSKSFSRSDRPSLSSSRPDLSSTTSQQTRSRTSTDTTATTVATMPTAAPSTSRSSFDKARKKLMSSSNRNSTDEKDSQNSHKRSDSVLSDETKQALAAYQNDNPPEDTAMLNEFDNLMRSNSTMKVSLTPDRLKTMEVYKQEKDRGNRRPAPLAFKTDNPDPSSAPPSRANGRRPSLRNVDSIVEDEEEIPSKSTPTPRKGSITSPNNLPSTSTTSVSSSSSRAVPRKSSRSNLSSSTSESTAPPMPPRPQQRGKPSGGPAGFNADPFPAKTRRIQKNRESLDLDAVMAGSDDDDDDDEPAPAPAPRTPSKVTTAPRSRNPSSPHAVSASTRDLMDFLAEGPPDVPKVSAAGREMMDFLAQGPPDQGIISSPPNGEKKSSGRLQRMISKLAMGSEKSEKSRSGTSEDFGRGRLPPTTPVRTTTPGMSHQTSHGNLANRPIPPRPPPVQPISPPSSPSDEDYGSARIRTGSVSQSGAPARRVMPTWEQQMADAQAPPVVPGKEYVGEIGNGANGNGFARNPTSRKSSAADLTKPRPKAGIQPPVSPTSPTGSPTATRKTSSAPPPPAPAAPAPLMAEDHARDMRSLLAKATNADECRLIFEMFLAKSGVAIEPAPVPVSYDVPYPSPSPSTAEARDTGEVILELSLVELFLGGGGEAAEVAPPPKKRRVRKKSEPASPSATATFAAPLAEVPIVADRPQHQHVQAQVQVQQLQPQPRKYATPESSSASTRTHTPVTVSEVGA
ncbi:hypothetical protein C8F04DRAFT_990625 [Mycena alexandri]|uniref:Uncharacterized protein n=1 Tax=Mycena alexandri TaxID=1745969 RepID=A0AAD6XE07_9AGAR|nr:hypothetical protein C8F04DRAFT_990625 [Mycena alexandri]